MDRTIWNEEGPGGPEDGPAVPGRGRPRSADRDHATDRHILVVDDSASQRRLLRSMLEPHGYTVLEAEDGLAALGVLRSQPVGIVLTDWHMPRMTGVELCRALQADAPERRPYVVLSSSLKSTAEVAAGLAAGADTFLPKPVTGGDLSTRLTVAERVERLRRQLERSRSDIARLSEALARQGRQARALVATLDGMAAALPCAMGSGATDAAVNATAEGELRITLTPAEVAAPAGCMVGVAGRGADWLALYAVDAREGDLTAAASVLALQRLLAEPPVPAAGRGLARGSGPDPAAVLERLDAWIERWRRVGGDGTLGLPIRQSLVVLSPATGLGQVALAGHPPPLFLETGAPPSPLGSAGPPLGAADREGERVSHVFQLARGERLALLGAGAAHRLAGAAANDGPPCAVAAEVEPPSVLARHRGPMLLVERAPMAARAAAPGSPGTAAAAAPTWREA